MDVAAFVQAVSELSPILGGEEDARQDVFRRLWEKRASVRDMLHYARRAASRAMRDASTRRRREAARFHSWEPCHEPASDIASPLEGMIEAENLTRLCHAIRNLPQGQRQAIDIEIDPVRQFCEIEKGPPRNSHRSNLYKAKMRLMALFADDRQADSGAVTNPSIQQLRPSLRVSPELPADAHAAREADRSVAAR